MKRVLVLGGYGGFGGRIARRLAKAGYEVLVAGRSLAKAEAFCAAQKAMRPLAFDLRTGLGNVLAAERPWALVDAAGPFQNSDYRVAEAALAVGCHYLDIADGRDFVGGIGSLDNAARERRVCVIGGASSVPALSGAAVRALAEPMASVRAVEIAISSSNRATAGPSVARAILSYVGRPIRLWRGRRWITRHGWHDIRRQDFTVAGTAPVRARLVALADVPDLDLLPGRLPGHPAVIFRAGTELALHNIMLWLLSWPVRWHWLGSLEPFARPILRAQKWTSALGSDRSAMIVRLFGLAGGRRVERQWTLIADKGDGPEIPSLAVPILLDRIAHGEIATGARDGGELLRLEDFEPAFSGLSVTHRIVEIQQLAPLYERIMGVRFAALSGAVRTMHDVLRDGGASGRATVRRGQGRLSRWIAAVMRFPPEGEHALHVHFDERRGVERWTRCFGRHCFSSLLSQRGPLLIERFGPLRFGFDLPSNAEGLTMVMRGWWIGPLPLPLALAPRSEAREWEEAGRFQFDVPITLPLIGNIVHYRGWLEPKAALPEKQVDE